MAIVAARRQAALTRYRVLRRFGPAASLVECRLATGRTHQIRVHLAAIGHPVDRRSGLWPDQPRRGWRPWNPGTRIAVTSLGDRRCTPICWGSTIHRTGAGFRWETEVPQDIRDLIQEF